MQPPKKFALLRSILRALGLSAEDADDIIDRVVDFLLQRSEHPNEPAGSPSQGDGQPSHLVELPSEQDEQVEYPYFVRDDFLSLAEHSFYLVLKTAISDRALICPKVALGDLFYAKSKDLSRYRTLTNRIDRKHVDFLLCDPKTARPLVGLELDDKSHQRDERRIRDEFVDAVFAAAKLPLVRVPVRPSYSVSELSALLRPHIDRVNAEPASQPVTEEKPCAAPRCPKCGGEMVLRTAKSGTNQGGKFWGCSDFPRCRGIVKYEVQAAV
jgi:hypothetical protein